MANAPAVLVQAGVQLVSAALYLWVARLVMRREVDPSARRANTLFGVWWFALGLVFLLAPLMSVPSKVFGYDNLPLVVTLLNILLALIVIAVWGLVYYLVYLYSGSSRAFWPISVFYALLGFGLLYLVAWLDPQGFDADGVLTYARPQLTGAPAISVGLLFSVPVVLAALAYGSLFFRVKGALPRYRIAMVAGAFIVQFGWSAISSALQLARRFPNSTTLALIGNVLGMLAATTVLLAFRPPAAIQKRLDKAGTGGS